jgi:hypothetical protein
VPDRAEGVARSGRVPGRDSSDAGHYFTQARTTKAGATDTGETTAGREIGGPYLAALECQAISSANKFAAADLTLMRSLRKKKLPRENLKNATSGTFAQNGLHTLLINATCGVVNKFCHFRALFLNRLEEGPYNRPAQRAKKDAARSPQAPSSSRRVNTPAPLPKGASALEA